MARITAEAVGVCFAFGAASIAVSEVAELVARSRPDGPAADLFAELRAAHHRLRVLFADGHDATVRAVAINVLVLAERTASALHEEENRPGL